ncbi:MAG: acetyl-CoA carboxylase carboxyl transferase subunit beta [Verrucomicrobia bacterium CG_4_10_14_3_um_filter_43_23]|nr:MAG: acetyl-CoA carboxylase subunit beta [Verrucomicrobia bacterium CG1_02_43_26]PIP58766.1 MAG: acetyl-CoA carboxylase carboxyl transferase subunit beta [Verrucomicrobia bacterium CG22_combo_CG10-13_8_21_14_all_43_17]PIX57613.1 MAG: acetyl-CoA carboxylase carboxyl transferase subunit beta [Verrucomicrobia bacterium CG_4_10_14_3_um_filter_43_23]PIY61524.1 MAG: acetyl-CoA carboxylase carboxyl transferase subunit beta [Verrucomicrobia bacterium CG_4_10_14_0_8_um_filter_43_34]PJA44409.1 MAG: ac
MALFSKPKYSTLDVKKKKDIPAGLWTKCPKTGEIVYNKDLENNLNVVPNSGYHFPISAPARIQSLLDAGSFVEMDSELCSANPLQFKGVSCYDEKLKQYKKKTGLNDAVITGTGTMGGTPVNISVMDFRFLGASMGSVVGEKITRCIERAIKQRTPVIIVSASGGARMYEGILSLMQMAKTSAALSRLALAGLPYISVLTNPTMAGVMASFASLGDIILAEPGALIGFAGPRVIKETTQQELPEGFQTSEFLLERGLIDQIVTRHELRDRITYLIKTLSHNQKSELASA